MIPPSLSKNGQQYLKSVGTQMKIRSRYPNENPQVPKSKSVGTQKQICRYSKENSQVPKFFRRCPNSSPHHRCCRRWCRVNDATPRMFPTRISAFSQQLRSKKKKRKQRSRISHLLLLLLLLLRRGGCTNSLLARHSGRLGFNRGFPSCQHYHQSVFSCFVLFVWAPLYLQEKKVKKERQLVNLFWILLRIAESEENSTCKKQKKKENQLGCTYIHTYIHDLPN